MKKNKNGGFVLVETLVVTVFVAAIFSIIFLNFYPLIGEYERRENYDDVDSKYAAYWVKKMLQDTTNRSIFNQVDGVAWNEVFCGVYDTNHNNDADKVIYLVENGTVEEFNKVNNCVKLRNQLGIKHIYITFYDISSIKDRILTYDNLNIPQGFKDYINYLPNYTAGSLNGAKYRVLIEIEHKRPYTNSSLESEDITEYPYNTYATLEVIV